MAENNATCSICDNGYHLCLSCKDSIKLSPWKLHCCSVECYQIFQAIKGFSNGVYNKDEFKSKLKKIDLSNLENYREHIKVLIKDALKEDEHVVKFVERVRPIETEVAEVKDNAVVDNVKNTVRPIVPRKRNYKVEAE